MHTCQDIYSHYIYLTQACLKNLYIMLELLIHWEFKYILILYKSTLLAFKFIQHNYDSFIQYFTTISILQAFIPQIYSTFSQYEIAMVNPCFLNQLFMLNIMCFNDLKFVEKQPTYAQCNSSRMLKYFTVLHSTSQYFTVLHSISQ